MAASSLWPNVRLLAILHVEGAQKVASSRGRRQHLSHGNLKASSLAQLCVDLFDNAVGVSGWLAIVGFLGAANEPCR